MKDFEPGLEVESQYNTAASFSQSSTQKLHGASVRVQKIAFKSEFGPMKYDCVETGFKEAKRSMLGFCHRLQEGTRTDGDVARMLATDVSCKQKSI